MIIRERGMYSVNLTLKDFQNIVRWKANACKENESLNDQETETKVAAIMIFLKESMEEEKDHNRRGHSFEV
ncbi:MAG: hypothetical protein HOB51_00685 [Thaumarchaeota archaeon]|jgi:hypothetical protein|nr:hypothetical protein [Candidatus Nitrosopelagicus sp.]MBT6646024.1 hypothetical protein [Nitrososphaerota archaeon]MDC0150401.1 hypothetical protein [Nitrosopumilus sp.]